MRSARRAAAVRVSPWAFRISSLALVVVAACHQRARGTQNDTRSDTRDATLTQRNATVQLRHAGGNRNYIIHIPSAREPARALPLLLAFHGGGGNAAGFQAYAGLDSVADREGFIVVYPNGTGGAALGLLTWNAGECCGYAMNQRVDDVGFIDAVLDDVARRVPVDTRRVYATGHSNGAMMAYRLGAERANRIAAIAPVAGAYDMESFAPSQPVAVLHIHSVDDPRALYAGGVGPPFPGTNSRSSHRPAMDGINNWIRNNQCMSPPRETRALRGLTGTSNAGQTATLLEWTCVAGSPVAHWLLTGVGHGWPGRDQPALREQLIGPSTTIISAAEEVWRFVSAIRR